MNKFKEIRPIVLGLAIKDNKLLVSEGFDKVKNQTFYRCLGGGIEFLEKSTDALKREFKEEIKTQMDSAASAKCQLGMISFEKEQEIIKCKRYIKKLQAKLISFGVVFGKKRPQK